MSERIKAILDVVTVKVLSYRPVDKGLAAKKTALIRSLAGDNERKNAALRAVQIALPVFRNMLGTAHLLGGVQACDQLIRQVSAALSQKA